MLWVVSLNDSDVTLANTENFATKLIKSYFWYFPFVISETPQAVLTTEDILFHTV